jgi:hypothetical protein
VRRFPVAPHARRQVSETGGLRRAVIAFRLAPGIAGFGEISLRRYAEKDYRHESQERENNALAVTFRLLVALPDRWPSFVFVFHAQILHLAFYPAFSASRRSSPGSRYFFDGKPDQFPIPRTISFPDGDPEQHRHQRHTNADDKNRRFSGLVSQKRDGYQAGAADNAQNSPATDVQTDSVVLFPHG